MSYQTCNIKKDIDIFYKEPNGNSSVKSIINKKNSGKGLTQFHLEEEKKSVNLKITQ